jgi:hypothetical protein
MTRTFYFKLSNVHFESLISILIAPHWHFKYNAWTHYEIELTLDSESEASDENRGENIWGGR